jgi:hypothetical protein
MEASLLRSDSHKATVLQILALYASPTSQNCHTLCDTFVSFVRDANKDNPNIKHPTYPGLHLSFDR